MCVTPCHLGSRPSSPSAAARTVAWTVSAYRRDRQLHRKGASAASTLRARHFRCPGGGQRRFEADTETDMACQHGPAVAGTVAHWTASSDRSQGVGQS